MAEPSVHESGNARRKACFVVYHQSCYITLLSYVLQFQGMQGLVFKISHFELISVVDFRYYEVCAKVWRNVVACKG